MKKHKFLFFSSRIPESNSLKAADLINMIKLLSKRYKVSYVVFQSLFTDESTLKAVKESGADLVDFKKYDARQNLKIRVALIKIYAVHIYVFSREPAPDGCKTFPVLYRNRVRCQG